MSAEKRNLLVESPERLHRLTDVIFAVSMVLFIVTGMFSINDAEFWNGYDINPRKFVSDRAYELLISFLVFLFMAIYWYTNAKQSKYLVKVDSIYTWINIFYLFFIAVAPLPNALSIHFGDNFYVQLFFGIVMFFIGVLSFLSWFYASKNHRLVLQEISVSDIKAINREMAVEPLVALISIIATFFSTALWEPVLLLMPVGIVAVTIKNARDKKKELARP